MTSGVKRIREPPQANVSFSKLQRSFDTRTLTDRVEQHLTMFPLYSIQLVFSSRESSMLPLAPSRTHLYKIEGECV